MSRYLISLILLVFLAAPALSQDEEPADVTPEAEQDADSAPPDEVITGDEDLDEQTYEDDEDDFVPTEEIPADEPIPFPSNI